MVNVQVIVISSPSLIVVDATVVWTKLFPSEWYIALSTVSIYSHGSKEIGEKGCGVEIILWTTVMIEHLPRLAIIPTMAPVGWNLQQSEGEPRNENLLQILQQKRSCLFSP